MTDETELPPETPAEPVVAPPVDYTCSCPGGRRFEFLNEPPEADGQCWHVCACCGTRKLLPPAFTLDHNDTPMP